MCTCGMYTHARTLSCTERTGLQEDYAAVFGQLLEHRPPNPLQFISEFFDEVQRACARSVPLRLSLCPLCLSHPLTHLGCTLWQTPALFDALVEAARYTPSHTHTHICENAHTRYRMLPVRRKKTGRLDEVALGMRRSLNGLFGHCTPVTQTTCATQNTVSPGLSTCVCSVSKACRP